LAVLVAAAISAMARDPLLVKRIITQINHVSPKPGMLYPFE
jgi:hypothetical protein